jgi:cytochrome c553
MMCRRFAAAAALLVACGGKDMPAPPRATAGNELRSVDAFAAIADPAARSQALFAEASRALLHARCVNCHPDGDSPHQGMELEPHDPPVERGAHDDGVAGMQCATCHQDRNQPLTRVPGAPQWHLAPRVMAWAGRTPRQLCEQLKDPTRNGNKTLAQIVDHTAHDPLVGWGWSPGADREPAPGTQAQLGALVAAWVETGAACPEEAAR